MPKPGWLKRQLDAARKDFESWPEWMKREAENDRKIREETRRRGYNHPGGYSINPDEPLSVHQ